MFYTVLHTWTSHFFRPQRTFKFPGTPPHYMRNGYEGEKGSSYLDTTSDHREHWSSQVLRCIVCKSGMKVQRNPRRIRDQRFLKGRVTHQAVYLIRPLLCHLSMTSSESYSYSLANSSAVALWEILVLRGSRADCNVELQTRALVQSDVHAKRWTRWNTPECTCFLLGGAERGPREAMNALEHS